MTKKNEIHTGDQAPAFSLPDSEGMNVSLSDFKDKWVILYFYPKDNTSGCTTEAIDFTARKEEFSENNAVIIGISADSCNSHQKFMLKYNLGIILLSDENKKSLEEYGVWEKKSMYGREYFGVVRTTVLIARGGKIARIWPKVSVNGHADDVLEALRAAVI